MKVFSVMLKQAALLKLINTQNLPGSKKSGEVLFLSVVIDVINLRKFMQERVFTRYGQCSYVYPKRGNG